MRVNPDQSNNPRGWFLDPKGVDVTTPAGRAAFKERVLQYADGSVALLKKMGAQGSIVWDLEGQEYPHATSYLGDPRSLPEEMDAVADEFFARLRSDGLRTGVGNTRECDERQQQRCCQNVFARHVPAPCQ